MAIVSRRLGWPFRAICVRAPVGCRLSVQTSLPRWCKWFVRGIYEAIFCWCSVGTHDYQAPALGGRRSVVRSAKTMTGVILRNSITCYLWKVSGPRRWGTNVIRAARKTAATVRPRGRWAGWLRCGGQELWRLGTGIAYRGGSCIDG